MTQKAGPESVLGDFDDVHLTADDKSYHLTREGDDFYVELEFAWPEKTLDERSRYPWPNRPQGQTRQRIALTTGSHNMQVYWYETGHRDLRGDSKSYGREGAVLGMLPFTWQVEEGRWITRRAAFITPHTDEPQARILDWNMVCLKCHATHARPRVKRDSAGVGMLGAFTQVGEFGIACESCHGPGEEHVAANQNPLRRYRQRASGEPDPTIVNPSRLSPKLSTQVCGSCHADLEYNFNNASLEDWIQNGFKYRPGEDLSRYYRVDTGGDDQFWPDGLNRVAGREYNALLTSDCHEKGGMTCLTCHVQHQPSDDPRPREEWKSDQLHNIDIDQTCLQCHPSFEDDIPAHTHHAAGSEGSSCQNCHMPHTTYGLMKGVRTHRIMSPSVQSTLATGRPNACNQCHLDQTLEWTASHLHEWFGTEIPELKKDDREISAGVLWALKGDAAQRALAAWAFSWPPAQAAAGRSWMAPYLAELLLDPYEAVRIIAERSLRTLPGYETFRHNLIGTPEERGTTNSAALDAWKKSGDPVAVRRRSRVLIAGDGTLMAKVYARVRKMRNNRIYRLFE